LDTPTHVFGTYRYVKASVISESLSVADRSALGLATGKISKLTDYTSSAFLAQPKLESVHGLRETAIRQQLGRLPVKGTAPGTVEFGRGTGDRAD
jgi:hypothetical protein